MEKAKYMLITLKDLENRKLITLSDSFNSSNLLDMESGLNNIFLESTEFIGDNTDLKLICKTTQGSEMIGHIHSVNQELLKQIKNEIDKLKNKSIDDIYYTKLNIELNI